MCVNLPYQYTLDIVYINDMEYRQCLRNVFCMISPDDSDVDIDEITRDENNYDEENAKKALDYIYCNTNDHPLFLYLYKKAASQMLSLDEGIGLSVLCSYDYLQMFHKCFQCFMIERETFNDTHPYYLRLKNAL